eukprot:SAG11_NODE_788_length_7169_cov_1.889109_2_plen_327_part_00
MTTAQLLAGVGAQNSFAVKTGRRTVADDGSATVNGAGAQAALLDGEGRVDDCEGDAAHVELGSGSDGDDDELNHQRSCYLCKNWCAGAATPAPPPHAQIVATMSHFFNIRSACTKLLNEEKCDALSLPIRTAFSPSRARIAWPDLCSRLPPLASVVARRFTKMHHFYDQFCPACAEINWQKRHQTADLSGRVALITGGRVKIGYQTALKLLRCGATTVVTSRFPADAARRFAAERDFPQWSAQLHCHGLDLRNIAGVEAFCAHVGREFGSLDILVRAEPPSQHGFEAGRVARASAGDRNGPGENGARAGGNAFSWLNFRTVDDTTT